MRENANQISSRSAFDCTPCLASWRSGEDDLAVTPVLGAPPHPHPPLRRRGFNSPKSTSIGAEPATLQSPAHRLFEGDPRRAAPMEMTMKEANRWAIDQRAEIAALRRQYQALDDTVRAMESQPSPDQLQIVRVKKRKLALRDRITELEDRITPDLIA
jgi:hypothetical protein